MTWEQIKKRTQSLGFCSAEDFERDHLPFLAAEINAALRDIALVCPVKKSVSVTARAPENIIEGFGKKHLLSTRSKKKEPIVYTAKAPLSYYFECSGNASVRFETEDGRTLGTVDANSKNFVSYRGFLESEGQSVKMIFEGDYSYDIRNTAMYGELYGDKESDILPFSAYAAYTAKDLCADIPNEFIRFDSRHPVTCKGAPFTDYSFSGADTLLLPTGINGEIRIFFDVYPVPVNEHSPEDYVSEISSAAEEIAILYAAARLYAEDLPERAASYYSQYCNLRDRLYDDIPRNDIWQITSGWF